MRTSITQHFRSMILTGLVCLAAALLLPSCSQKPQDQIVGKWMVQGQSNIMEFRKDGTLLTMENGKETTAKYKFVNDTNMQIQINVPVHTNNMLVQLSFDVAIHGDSAELSVTLPVRGGAPSATQTTHLSRIK